MGPEGCSGVSVEMSEMLVEQNSGTFLVHRRKTGITLFNIYMKNVIFMQLQYSDFRKYLIKYNYN